MVVIKAFLDVSDLEPPEPLVKAMAAAERLEVGGYLHMRHRREPCLLYGNLEKRGFAHDTRQGSQGECEVFIWRQDDVAAQEAAQEEAAHLPSWQG